MIVSPRVTRAALAFLLFGTAAALLPSQDTTALAENGCFTGPPGSTGQLAIALTSSDIRDAYTLVPAAATYKIYFKPDAASPYSPASTGETATVFTLNSGRVVVNGTTYFGANPTYTNASSFAAAQAVVFTAGKPANAPGNMTVTSTYTSTDSRGQKTTYTATANFSAP